jgi:hypothetical protein
VVIFMSVVGCGTASVMPTRQKRRQARESVISAHRVSKPRPKAQEHHPQIRLHRDRGSPDLRMEERNERLEEHRVVEQLVHFRKSWWKAQEFRREDCFP